MKIIRNHLFTIICMSLALLAWGDSGHLYTSGKLSSNLINCITQDPYGYIWIGTEYGLSKFDGYKFHNYYHNEKDTNSIITNTISAFLVDKKGNLWIGSAKGIMRYDYINDEFIKYRMPDHRKPRIYSIIENKKGDILIGTAGYGLYSIKKGKNTIIHEKEYSRRDSDVFFSHIFEDNRGNLWQGSHLSTISRFYKKGNNLKIQDYQSLYGPPVKYFQTRRNLLLIVCMYGIIQYDYTTNKLSDAGYDFGTYKGSITINSALFDYKGNLYIGTSESGVLYIPRGSKKLIPYTNRNKDHFNLSASSVSNIFEDKDNNLWIGCFQKGLYLINDEIDAFSTWSFSNQGYDLGSSVSSIASGDNGTTWCTVQNSGVYQFDEQGKIIGHPKSPTGTSIIYRDQNGGYWLGTSNGLYSYNPITGDYKLRISFSSVGVFGITDDGMGKLYISVYSKGLYIFDTKTNETKILSMRKRTNHGYLCNDWISYLMFDRQGLLWITTSNGVACLDPKTDRFDNFGWNSILNDIQSNYLCEDQKGNIIIGTDNGLFYFDIKTNKVQRFKNSESLNNKQICSIVKDNNDDIWVSSTMGIWQYNHKENKFISHINGSGLATHEYVRGALLHNSDDFIGFGFADGITTFYPAAVNQEDNNMDNVYLTDFIIDGKSTNCQLEEYEIPYDQNSFTLEFSLLNYKNATNISFEYRINGGEWKSTEEGMNSISFNKLEPGEYIIEVRAANNGIYSKNTRKVSIYVRNPWYASTIAFIIYFILGGGFIFFFLRSYEKRRTADLDEQKMKFLIDATHEIRSPLTLIMGPLRKLKEHIISEEDQQNIETIDRNEQRLLLLVNQILDERKLDKNQMRIQCQETNMNLFIKNICSLYQYNADERNIKLKFIPEKENIHTWIDRINFDKVISNLLSNALKYTFDGGEIDIFLNQDEKNMILKAQDTGVGFRGEKTEKLFDRFYQGRNSTDLHIIGTGIGLNLCKAIVNMHGGIIKAYNREDGLRGACLEVDIPLGNKHLKQEEILEKDKNSIELSSQKKNTASKNFKILIVDDNVEIAQYISSELGEWYRFESAPNGKIALKMLLNKSYDLVISDVMMPEMDGITLLKNIKSNVNISDIPVILLTSKSEVAYRLEGLKKGADAFLAKPFNMEELHILIDNLVDNVRRLRGKFSGAQKQQDKIDQVEVKSNNDALMERVMKCINEHLDDPDFNVEKLTEDVGISRAQLHRKMKEITGISTGEFIRNLRLEQAERLIKEGRINITQIAYAVGFNNQTHFSTVFKKHFGMTPTEYSEKQNN